MMLIKCMAARCTRMLVPRACAWLQLAPARDCFTLCRFRAPTVTLPVGTRTFSEKMRKVHERQMKKDGNKKYKLKSHSGFKKRYRLVFIPSVTIFCRSARCWKDSSNTSLPTTVT